MPLPAYNHRVLDQQVEELAHWIAQRHDAVQSSDVQIEEFRELDERIRASLLGVLAVYGDAQDHLFELLSASDPTEMSAIAFAMLSTRDPCAADRVLHAFLQAQDEHSSAMAAAMQLAPCDHLKTQLTPVFEDEANPRTAAAAMVLAAHGFLPPNSASIGRLLVHKQPPHRAAGWKAVALAGN